MMAPTQILLVIVVVTLTALLLIMGIQVFFILQEIRRSVEKINKILEDGGLISESIAKPISSISNSLVNFSGITGFLGWLASRKKIKTEKKNE